MLKNLKNFSFRFTVLFSVFYTLTHSPVLWAQVGRSEIKKIDAVLLIPYAAWLTRLQEKNIGANISIDQQLGQIEYTNQDASLKFVSERENLKAQFDYQTLKANSGSEIELNLKLREALVQISNFNLVATVQKDLGFGSATLKLDMHCDAINLKVQNENSIHTSVSVNQGSFSILPITWDLKSSQIQTELIGCKEVAGFDHLLKEQIQKMLEQSYVVGYLQKAVNERINDLINSKIAEQLSELANQYKIENSQNFLFDENNNLWVFSDTTLLSQLTQVDMGSILKSTKPLLIIKKQNLEAVSQLAINEFLKSKVLSSKDLSALNKLTCSRLLQTFVWPALKTFNKCFEMNIVSQVKNFKILDLQRLSFSYEMHAWATVNNKNIAFFNSKMSSNLVNMQTQLLSFEAISNLDFINSAGRSGRISSGLIQTALLGLIPQLNNQLKENKILKLFLDKRKLKALSEDIVTVEINN